MTIQHKARKHCGRPCEILADGQPALKYPWEGYWWGGATITSRDDNADVIVVKRRHTVFTINNAIDNG